MRRGLALFSLLAIVAMLAAMPSAAAPKPAPPIAGKTLAGKRLALADLRGKPVVINVWSSW